MNKELKIEWEHCKAQDIDELDDYYDDLDEEHDDYDDGHDFSALDGSIVLMQNTPLGQYPVKYNSTKHPYEKDTYFRGHTNFQVIQYFLDSVANIDGVDMVTPISKYRFMICIGRLFDFRDVLPEINKIISSRLSLTELDKVISEPKFRQKIKNSIRYLNNHYNHWSAVFYRDGKIDLETSESQINGQKIDADKKKAEDNSGLHVHDGIFFRKNSKF